MEQFERIRREHREEGLSDVHLAISDAHLGVKAARVHAQERRLAALIECI